jgi:hypothetical protein
MPNMLPHFLNLAHRTWGALMQKTSLSTFGFILFSLLVPVVAGVLASFLAYLKNRKEGNLALKAITYIGIESAGVTLGAVIVVVGIAFLVFFVPTIYDIHIFQQQQILSLVNENQQLSSDIQDRKRDVRIQEPAYEHIKVLFAVFTSFRHAIGAKTPCGIRITAPKGSRGPSDPIIRQVADVAALASGCGVFGPGDANMDPDEEKMAVSGMKAGLIVIHTTRRQAGSLAFYDALASYLPLTRSYDMPAPVPRGAAAVPTLIWFQFSKDVHWTQ